MTIHLRGLIGFVSVMLICFAALHAGSTFAQGAIASAVDEDELAAMTEDQRARYKNLVQELRCLVCQNQPIADSNAELANDLRRQVLEQIAAGKSDDEIRNYATDRYGEFVLYKPRFNAVTALLWFGPALLVMTGLLIVWRLLRKKPANEEETVERAIDPADVKRVLDKIK